MATDGMVYEVTGEVKSNRNVVEQSAFKEMRTYNIIMGATRELYRRYAVEFWAVLFWLSIAIDIWRAVN